MNYSKDFEPPEKIECPGLTENKLCLFYPSKLCWQLMDPAPAIDKPCEGSTTDFTVDPCINYVEYWKEKKHLLPPKNTPSETKNTI